MPRSNGQQLIQVFEYDRIFYHKKFNGIQLTESQFDALVQYNVRNDDKYFTVIHKGVRFQQYVGVIQVGNLTIEILPKADRTDKPNKEKWQKVLFQMLRACQYIQLESTEDAHLHLRNASLIDLFIEQYLRSLEAIIHQGLVKQYRKKTSNQKALVGSLQFGKHIAKNLVHKERFYVRHQVYDTNHLLHQILHEALKIVPIISSNPNLMDNVNRQMLHFLNLPTRNIKTSDFEQLVYNRKTKHYRKAILLAKLLLLNFSPDVQTGKENVLAILFDMNTLFEEYVFRQIKKEKGVKVGAQNSKQFWNTRTIRPDIVVEMASKKYILDTKWKVLTKATPSDADLKQMYAYQNYWDAEKTVLLYPQVYDLPNKTGIFNKEKKECALFFLPLLNKEGGLNQHLGTEILELLETTTKELP